MVVSPLAEAITASFYAWEVRGRGWTVAPYPVVLEPPYRHCFLLPGFEKAIRPADDGRRPTFLSSLVDGVRDTFRAPVPVPVPAPLDTPAFEETAPYPAELSDERVTLRILTPSEFATDLEATRRFLTSLSILQAPFSFELLGHNGRVHCQVAIDANDAERITGALTGYFPGAAIALGEDCLERAWDTNAASFFVDFGLADEFFLPFQSFKNFSLDPYITLVAALGRALADETLVFQVLVSPVVNRWDRAIMGALVSSGEPVFEDAPEFLPLAKEKLAAPLFAVVVRLSASAGTRARARELVRGTADFFTQFSRPGGNSFIPLTNDGYPDDDHESALLLRTTHRTGMLLSAVELAGLMHLPDASVRHPALVRLEKRTKALPHEARGHPLTLGVNEHQNVEVPVTVDLAARMRHMHLVGASGTGKSTLLLNLITQDVGAGHGVAVLDPHGDLIDAVLARLPPERSRDVVLFDPADEVAPVGLNLLQAATPVEKTLLSSDLVSIFQRYATSWGDAMSTVMGNAVLALLERESKEPATLLDLRRFLVEERFRSDFLSRVSDPEVQFFWRHEFPLIGNRALGPILTRLNTFLRPRLVRNVVAQRRPRVSLETVVNGRKIFLAKLSQGFIGRENCYLLGSLIATKFHQVAVSRQALAPSDRLPFFLYIDEFQHFITPSIESLLTEARKYSIGLVLAHQTLQQLREVPMVEAAVLGNAHTRINFRVGDDDARRLSEGLSFFESKDLSNLGQGEAIVRLGLSGNDFNLRVPAPSDTSGGEDAVTAIRNISRAQFGTDAHTLAQELAASYGAVEEERTKPAEPQEIATDTQEHESPVTTQTAPLSAKPLVSEGKSLSVSPKVKAQPLIEGRGGKEHTYLQHLVKRLAEERGFQATIEQPILDGAGSVDVSLVRDDVRIAFEISVTTGSKWEGKNVKQCLSAGYDHVVLVMQNERAVKSFEKRLAEEFSESERGKVRTILGQAVVEFLDQFQIKQEENVVRGYKVKVRRRSLSPEDGASRRSGIAGIVARSLEKNKGK